MNIYIAGSTGDELATSAGATESFVAKSGIPDPAGITLALLANTFFPLTRRR